MRADSPNATDLVPAATAGALALVAVGLGWRGADWPAQLLRLELVERDGPAVWNNLWFAGHHTPGYGLLFPMLGALVGATTTAIASCVVAAGSFHLLVRDGRRRSTAASVLFAAGTVVNVAVGRLTFALGLASGMAALAALRHHRYVLATLLIVATAPASPVAGVMLSLTLTAWGLQARRASIVVLAALAAAPVAAATLWFPQGGRFPFLPGAFLWSIVVAAIVAWATDVRVVRLGAAFYVIACTATFIVPNPLGANVTRLGMFFAPPVLVLTARGLRSPFIALSLIAMVWWQWSPALDGVARAGSDPSSAATFHAPLIDAVQAAGGPEGRIEVVPTQRHWETVFVAAALPLARGWERQLDIGRNAVFYGPELDPATYHRWLRDHAVQFVALADVPLDPSAEQEAALLRDGLPFLEPVWHSEHWRLWRVVDAEPLVDGAARLVRVGATEIVLDVTSIDPVMVRVHYSSHWSLDRPGCVEAAPDGWTIVRPEQLGPVSLRPVLARSLPIIGALDDCRS